MIQTEAQPDAKTEDPKIYKKEKKIKVEIKNLKKKKMQTSTKELKWLNHYSMHSKAMILQSKTDKINQTSRQEITVYKMKRW